MTSPLEISIQISMIGNLLAACAKITPPSGGPALLNAAAVKLTLVFLTCSNHQEPCGQRFYFRACALEFLIQTSGPAIRNSTVLPAGNGVAHRLRLRSVEGDFCNFDQILTTDGDARKINRVLGFIGVQVCDFIRP